MTVPLLMEPLLLLAALLGSPQEETPEEKEKKKPKATISGFYPFGSRCRDGHPTPVRIELKSTLKETVRARVVARWAMRSSNAPAIKDGVGPIYELETELPAFSSRMHSMTVETEDPDRLSLWVYLLIDGEMRSAFEVSGRPIARLASCTAVVGPTTALGFPPPAAEFNARESAEYVAILPENLPDRWYGYLFADHLIWVDGDPAQARDPAQAEALKLWVAGGGHLVVAADRPDGLTGTFLEPLLPVRPGKSVTLAYPLVGSVSFPASTTALQSTPRPGARVVARHEGTPMHVEGTYGRGRVTFLAFSPAAQPFREHPKAPDFWTGLLGLTRDQIDPQIGFQLDQPTPLDEMLGDARLLRWITDYSSIPPPRLTWAFSVILLYVLLVGPIDYLMLRSINRMYWTWFTFTSYVVGFSALVLIAGASLADHPAAVREFAVLDCMPEASVTRGVSVTGVLNPMEGNFTLKPEGPGDWLSALDRDPGTIRQLLARPHRIVQDERRTIHDWDFPRGQLRWAIRQWCEAGAPPATAELRDSALEVTHALPVPIRDAALWTSEGVYRLGVIPPGTHTFTLEGMTPLKPADFLAQLRATDPGANPTHPLAWVPTFVAPEPRRDLKPAELQGWTDVSEWPAEGRAILVGVMDAGGWLEFGAKKPGRSDLTVVRIFLPYR